MAAKVSSSHLCSAGFFLFEDLVDLRRREELSELLVILLAHVEDSTALGKIIQDSLLYLFVSQRGSFRGPFMPILVMDSAHLFVVRLVECAELLRLFLVQRKGLAIMTHLLSDPLHSLLAVRRIIRTPATVSTGLPWPFR